MAKSEYMLYKGINEMEKEAEQQDKLRKKYDVKTDEGEKIKIVEKSNMAKFTIKTFANLVRIISSIFIILFAAIGILTLAYPPTRYEFLKIFKDMQGYISMAKML